MNANVSRKGADHERMKAEMSAAIRARGNATVERRNIDAEISAP